MAASQTPTVSVAAIESVEMDMEEEDAMMEAIQGQGTRILNLHGLTWNSQVVQQLARGKKLQTRLKTKCPSSNRSPTMRRTSSWPPWINPAVMSRTTMHRTDDIFLLDQAFSC